MGYSSPEKPVLLIGSNVRFLAENAVRHGHHIFTVDYYGDWDTRQLGPNRSIIHDGDGDFSIESLVNLAEGIANCGIVYGPGFENDIRAFSITLAQKRTNRSASLEVAYLCGRRQVTVGGLHFPRHIATIRKVRTSYRGSKKI